MAKRRIHFIGVTLLLTSTALVGCMTQDPAPVVAGRLSPYPSPQTSQEITPKTTAYMATPTIESNDLPEVSTKTAVSKTYHVVQKGEGLYGIAREYGSTVEGIMAANDITDPGALMIGQSLEIPSSSGSATSTTGSYSLTAKYGADTKADTTASTWTKPKTAETVASTTSATGAWTASHVVQKGENAYRIAMKYGTNLNTLLSKNSLSKSDGLTVGQSLTVPSKGIDQMTTALAVSPSHPDYGKTPNGRGNVTVALKKVSGEKPKTVAMTKTNSIKRSPMMASGIPANGMMWPAEGSLIKRFGTQKDGVKHTGINIKLDRGAPVYAAEEGTVIYADNGLKSYGNLVLIQHKGGVVTAYGHNDVNKVRKSEKVKKGQVIALAGTSGGVDQPQLHFEVRKNAAPVNPLTMLPRK